MINNSKGMPVPAIGATRLDAAIGVKASGWEEFNFEGTLEICRDRSGCLDPEGCRFAATALGWQPLEQMKDLVVNAFKHCRIYGIAAEW